MLAEPCADGRRRTCASFKWPLEREQAWLRAPHPSLPSGSVIASPEGAVTLGLHPIASMSFAIEPEHRPPEGSHGGTLSLPASDGVVQVTLSDDGWIDVVQDKVAVRSLDFTGLKGCPGLRKSVRFKRDGTPVMLQISGASGTSIEIAVGPAP